MRTIYDVVGRFYRQTRTAEGAEPKGSHVAITLASGFTPQQVSDLKQSGEFKNYFEGIAKKNCKPYVKLPSRATGDLTHQYMYTWDLVSREIASTDEERTQVDEEIKALMHTPIAAALEEVRAA